jgi:hypothetical protein
VRRLVLLVAAAPLLTGALAACGSDDDGYCDAVEEHQQELTELIGSDEPDALLDAADILGELRDRAPSDIADEWQVLLRNIGALDQAVEAAGVDPETYDPRHPPPGVTAAQQQAIRAAVRGLTSRETLDALAAVDQQVRDVCHTPLTL